MKNRVEIWTDCSRCGGRMKLLLAEDIAEDELLREANCTFALCPLCEALAEKERAAEAEKEHRLEEQHKLNLTYKKRREQSRLDEVYLGWDDNHSGANRELKLWLESRWRDNSLLLVGSTGTCKSRLAQMFGYEFLRDCGSVYFGRATQLADEISGAFKGNPVKGLQLMKELYGYDLLIIDDFGQETLSDARISRLWDLIDMRYTQWNRERNIRSGKWNPLYGQSNYGARLWITTNDGALEMLERFGDKGASLVRRLKDMCEINHSGKVVRNAVSASPTSVPPLDHVRRGAVAK
ncbi:MAG: ATP-binding protein [Victivallales bacterium]|nr:ATP-binding protein [Victivallales bacterium]